MWVQPAWGLHSVCDATCNICSCAKISKPQPLLSPTFLYLCTARNPSDIPQGLPFNVSFDYSIYTLSYVLLQGYGEVGVGQKGLKGASLDKSSERAGAGAVTKAEKSRHVVNRNSWARRALRGILRGSTRGQGQSSLSDLDLDLQHPDPARSSAAGKGDDDIERCPYSATPLPIDREEIALEPHMVRVGQ